jgi:hypothetical protein
LGISAAGATVIRCAPEPSDTMSTGATCASKQPDGTTLMPAIVDGDRIFTFVPMALPPWAIEWHHPAMPNAD